jgi:hypothetical protein
MYNIFFIGRASVFVMPCFLVVAPQGLLFRAGHVYNLVIQITCPEYHHRLFGWTWGFRRESFSMIFKSSFLMTQLSTPLG